MQKPFGLLLLSILLVSSGCLASPSHKRAAAAAHWGQDPETIDESSLDQPELESVTQKVPKKLTDQPVNNWAGEEEVAKPDLEQVDTVTEKLEESAAPEQQSTDAQENPLGIPDLKEILEASNKISDVNLDDVDIKNIMVVKEKDGDAHIHIRIPSNGNSGSKVTDVIEDDIGMTDSTELDEDVITTDNADGEIPTATDAAISEGEVEEKQSDDEADDSYFKHADGSLNWLAILALMFLLFI